MRFLVIICGVMLSGALFGQDQPPVRVSNSTNDKGNFLITYHLGVGNYIENEIRVEYFVHPNWSLIYSGSYSYNDAIGSTEIRTPLGATLGVGIAGLGACSYPYYSDYDLGLVMFSFARWIPDGVAYHFYTNSKLDISPYINASGLTYRTTRGEADQVLYSPKGGIRILFYAGKHIVLSAEQSFRMLDPGMFTSTTGASFSVRL